MPAGVLSIEDFQLLIGRRSNRGDAESAEGRRENSSAALCALCVSAVPSYYFLNFTVFPVLADSFAASRIRTTKRLFSSEYNPFLGT